MKIESEDDLLKKTKAIQTFVDVFGGSFFSLSFNDTDYKVLDKEKNLICYAEIVIVRSDYSPSEELKVTANRLVKLSNKRLSPVLIWAFYDGIVYTKVIRLNGIISWGDRDSTQNSYDNQELVVSFKQNKNFIYEKSIKR
jgi:hypothetical protein